MGAIKLSESVYSVGVLNPSLRVFDIVMESRYGTSYNAYVIKGEKNVLIDTVHVDYFDEYVENIQSVVGDLSAIDCLIVNHTEPDHSGSVAKLLELIPGLTVYCTNPAKKYLSAIANREFSCTVVKQGDSVELGGGRALSFIIAPLLHWPDTMMTWYADEKMLFTCDFLGAHFCEPTMFEEKLHYGKEYLEQFRYYYDCIFGPFKPYVIAGLDKIKDLGIKTVCPSHGPILTKNIAERMDDYRKWSTPAEQSGKKMLIVYASAYKYTALLAAAAFEAVKNKDGLSAECLDIVTTPLSEIAAKANEADALLVGSCTINRDAPKHVWDVLASIDAINTKSKPAGAFGSYGWSGEAVGMIRSRLSELKFSFVGDGVRVNFKPDENDLNIIKAYALEVAEKIK